MQDWRLWNLAFLVEDGSLFVLLNFMLWKIGRLWNLVFLVYPFALFVDVGFVLCKICCFLNLAFLLVSVAFFGALNLGLWKIGCSWNLDFLLGGLSHFVFLFVWKVCVACLNVFLIAFFAFEGEPSLDILQCIMNYMSA